MLSRRVVASWVPVLALASLIACNALKDAPPSAFADGGSDADDDDSPPDKADAAAPVDFECKSEIDAWTEKHKSNEACGSREVRVIEENVRAESVSIARTSAGRVGIVYSSRVSDTRSDLHLPNFTPSTPAFDVAVATRSIDGYVHTGQRSKISASPPDTFHVLSHDVHDATANGDVVLLHLPDGATFSEPELIMQGVASPSEIAIAVDAKGTAYMTVRTRAIDESSSLVARRKRMGDDVENLPVLVTRLDPTSSPTAGAASLVLDKNSKLHVLFYQNEFANYSSPRYHTLDADDWSYRKTIDNNVPDGLCGYSGQLAVFGTKKYAAYFFRKVAQEVPFPTAELHLAAWELETDKVSVELIEQKIPSKDALSPRYRVSLAVDRWGLVHMAIVRPYDSDETGGHLDYVRQTRSADGSLKWASDIIDPEVLSETDGAEVDIVVDENGRPHIAYLSGKDHSIRYATRYDR